MRPVARAHDHYSALEEDNAARAKALAAWMTHIQREWNQVRVEAVERGPQGVLTVGTKVLVRARVRLGSLLPEDITPELYVGRLNPFGDFIGAVSTPMESIGSDSPGTFTFEAVTTCPESGRHGFTVRVRPSHPDLGTRFLPGLICWADS